jgi:hypothetical protein
MCNKCPYCFDCFHDAKKEGFDKHQGLCPGERQTWEKLVKAAVRAKHVRVDFK